MTFLAKKKVETRVQDVLKARYVPVHAILPRPCAVGTDWQTRAVARFFTDYAVGSDAVPNTTVVLPGLYRSADAGACLQDAVHAAAFVNQANRLGLDWMAVEAKAAYGRALASFVRILLDSRQVMKDTTLAVPFVIGLYEVRPNAGSTYIRLRQRQADCPGTAHQWISANRYFDGSSSPSRSDNITAPSWRTTIQFSTEPNAFWHPARTSCKPLRIQNCLTYSLNRSQDLTDHEVHNQAPEANGKRKHLGSGSRNQRNPLQSHTAQHSFSSDMC